MEIKDVLVYVPILNTHHGTFMMRYKYLCNMAISGQFNSLLNGPDRPYILLIPLIWLITWDTRLLIACTKNILSKDNDYLYHSNKY